MINRFSPVLTIRAACLPDSGGLFVQVHIGAAGKKADENKLP